MYAFNSQIITYEKINAYRQRIQTLKPNKQRLGQESTKCSQVIHWSLNVQSVTTLLGTFVQSSAIQYKLFCLFTFMMPMIFFFFFFTVTEVLIPVYVLSLRS